MECEVYNGSRGLAVQSCQGGNDDDSSAVSLAEVYIH